MAKWQGKLIDSAGATGTVELDVVEGKQVARWRVQLASRDVAGEPMEGELSLEGELGKSEVRAKGEERMDDVGIEWELVLSPAPAGDYGQDAATGSYVVRSSGDKAALPVGQGVLVLWRFSD